MRPLGDVRPDARTVAVRDHPAPACGRGAGGGPGAPTAGESAVRPLPRDEQPSGVTVSRPAVVRAVPTTAAKVHVVEPHGFNDAQEVGDRVKANQAVILNLQSSPKELRRRLIDFSSGLAYAMGGSMSRVADAGVPDHPAERAALRGGEGSSARPGASTGATDTSWRSSARSSRSSSSCSFARAVLSWFPLEHGARCAQVSDLLVRLTDWALRPAAGDHPAGRHVRPVVPGARPRPVHPAASVCC